MFNGDLVMPVTFSKRDAAFGGTAAIGVRRDTMLEDVAKGMLTPLTPKGPVKKAPTLARTGPKPLRGMMVPSPSNPGRVTKSLSEISKSAASIAAEKAAAKADGPCKYCGLDRFEHKKHETAFTHSFRKLAPGEEVMKPLFSKAARSIDPEDRRQRRLGALSAGSAAGGAALAYSGGKEMRRDTTALRDSKMKIPPAVGPNAPKTVRAQKRVLGRATAIGRVRDAVKPGNGVLVTRKSGSRIAGGTALAAGSVALMRDHRQRRWN